MFFLDRNIHRWQLVLSILIVLLIFVGFWNIDPIRPALLLGVLGIYWFEYKYRPQQEGLPWKIFLLGLLLAAEGFSFLVSEYPPNSFLSFEKIFYWIVFCYVLEKGLFVAEGRNILIISLGVFSILVTCGALLTFLNTNANLQSEGWMDASQFKARFSPYQFKINDWATVALVLLPFPLMCIVLLRSIKWVYAAGLFGFGLVFFTVLISFSRGAYLSLGLFFILVFSGLVYYRLLSFRSIATWLLACTLVLVVFMLPISKPLMTTLAMNKTVSQQRSTAGRLDIIQHGWCRAKQYWLTGVGGYNYALPNPVCTIGDEDAGFSNFANTLYLQILIEKGIPGIVIYGLFFLFILFSFYKNRRHSPDMNERLIQLLLFSGFITYCFRELFFSSFFDNNPVMAMVGVYFALSGQRDRVEHVALQNKGSGTLNTVLKSAIVPLIVLGLAACFYFRHHRYDQSQKLSADATVSWYKGNIDSALLLINTAIQHTPDIAPYHELAGLIDGQINYPIHLFFNDSALITLPKIDTILMHVEHALRINPNDAGFLFNSAYWRYIKQGKLDPLARTHITQALHIEPTNTEFLIGAGLIMEREKDSVAAFQLYKKALRLDPEITDSEFFIDFKHRHPALGDTLIVQTIKTLSDLVDTSYNTVYAARFARLLWSQSSLQNNYLNRSKQLFLQVSQELPDLYRPYYFLGRVAEFEKDSSLALQYYRKSLFLGGQDYLAPLAMGDYYYQRMTRDPRLTNSVIRYYKNALANSMDHLTRHRNRAGAHYRMNVNLSNDLVFKNLKTYIRSKIDHKLLCLRLAEVYDKLGNKKRGAFYTSLSGKELDELRMEDFQ